MYSKVLHLFTLFQAVMPLSLKQLENATIPSFLQSNNEEAGKLISPPESDNGLTFEFKGDRLSCARNCLCEWPWKPLQPWLTGCREECCLLVGKQAFQDLQIRAKKIDDLEQVITRKKDKIAMLISISLVVSFLLILIGVYVVYVRYFQNKSSVLGFHQESNTTHSSIEIPANANLFTRLNSHSSQGNPGNQETRANNNTDQFIRVKSNSGSQSNQDSTETHV